MATARQLAMNNAARPRRGITPSNSGGPVHFCGSDFLKMSAVTESPDKLAVQTKTSRDRAGAL